MDTIQCIQSRRSIRKFKPEAVKHEEIEKIVAAAAYAPSWKNSQTARYLVVEDKTLIREISENGLMGFPYNQKTVSCCPSLVVITSVANRSGYERDGSYSTSKADKWEMFDAGVAAQTFMLAARELGIGTVPLGIFDENKVHRILNLPETLHVSVLIAMGYPDEAPAAPPRKTVEELLNYR